MKKFVLPIYHWKVKEKHQNWKNLCAETYDPKPAVLFKQTTVRNNESKPHFRKIYNFRHKSNQPVSNCFCKHREDGERKLSSYSQSKSHAEPLNPYFKAYQNQTHPNEQPPPPSYCDNYYSRNKYDTRYNLMISSSISLS